MKKFVIKYKEEAWPLRFFICMGDEYKKCNKCEAKFFCYTGELPNYYLIDIERNTFSSHLSIKLFGEEGFIKYYFYSHNTYYSTINVRNVGSLLD